MQEILEAIGGAGRFYLAIHVAPDGDALGAALGLYWALTKLGKEAAVACADALPEPYKFLPGSEWISARPPSPGEVIISLDSSDRARLGALFIPEAFRKALVINIDHHITNERFGDLHLVDSGAAATAQLVLRIVRALGVALDARIATCLLVGIVDDTQGFRTAGTTPEVLGEGAELMAAGANLADIMERSLNTHTFGGLLLWGQVLGTLQMEEGILWAWETHSMREGTGASLQEGRRVVNLLSGVREAKVALVFKERAGGLIEVSMRSAPDIDISPVALGFGGGGHPRAAGCNIAGRPEEVERAVLAQVKELLAAVRAEA